MFVRRLRLQNWMRFAGEHTIDLDPAVYGVVAQHDDDGRRSNWCGKTSFVEAIRFALYGVHRAPREDGWITHEAKHGLVEVTLDDGTEIRRWRTRKTGTQVSVRIAGSTEVAIGAAAETALVDHLGIAVEDFDVTCWFGQKQLANLVLARPSDPGERVRIVSGWIGLGELQAWADETRAHLGGISKEIDAAQRDLARAQAVIDAFAGRDLPGELTSAAQAEAEAEATVRAASALVRENAEQQKASAAAAELDRVRARGRELSTFIDERMAEDPAGAEKVARTRLDGVTQQLRAVIDERDKQRVLARGEFDGACPLDGHTCPARSEINERHYGMAARVRELGGEAARLTDEVAAHTRALELATETTRKVASAVEERDRLRKRARVLMDESAGAKPFDAAAHAARVDALEAAHAAKGQAIAARRAVEEALSAARTAEGAAGAAKEALDRLRAQERVGRAAFRIFGSQGAQKRMAEGVLATIEAGANDILASAGVALTLRLLWGREGVGLAAWCGECGAAFPSSRKVKSCERCGTERGPNIVERLDVELSDRSGAAEDLAGAALQLSAAKWLRASRGVALSVCFMDEPFGALDEAHRRSFAHALNTMMRVAGGFEQAFVIAHHPDVIAALPARVTIRANDTGSRLETS